MKRFKFIILLTLLASCHASKINMGLVGDQAPVVIYTTTGDYFNNVPIILNDSKDRIVSYPDPLDLMDGKEMMLPFRLKKGYLLDRRGLHINTAFISLTYEEYAALTRPPSLDELYNSIIDKDPFKTFYYCGKKADFSDLEKELNRRINRGQLESEL